MIGPGESVCYTYFWNTTEPYLILMVPGNADAAERIGSAGTAGILLFGLTKDLFSITSIIRFPVESIIIYYHGRIPWQTKYRYNIVDIVC